MTHHQHIILGYPNSGKTTYLAALWYMLDAGTTTSLTLEKVSGDMRYLNEIKSTWLKCEQVPRTTISTEEMVEIMVRDTSSAKVSTLQLPDFSGETFQALISNRACEKSFLATLDQSSGILFFVNADRSNDMMSVIDHNFQDDDAGEQADDTPESENLFEDFDARRMPEQTRIVDVLQLLQASPFRQTRRRLAIAISAWDVVVVDKISPQEWVAREMPLLDQFLANNLNEYEVCFCGISAQGGQFEGRARDHLLDKAPAERVVVEWDGVIGCDITLPLTWLSR